MSKSKQLTVKELITALQKCPLEFKVKIEGCDCYQEAATVETVHGDKRVQLDDYVLIGNTGG